MKWRIYYGDGTTFSDEDGRPEDAPALNIQAINQWDKQGQLITQCGFDYFWHEDNWWSGGDLFGLWDYMVRNKLIKCGRLINKDKFDELIKKAEGDPDFKTGASGIARAKGR